jgi:uncharacterized membrane protein YGL010W
VSIQIENLTERQLRFGVLKLGIALTFGLLVAATVFSVLLDSDSSLARVPINALLLAVAVSLLANGVLAVLKIIDWFEARHYRGDR